VEIKELLRKDDMMRNRLSFEVACHTDTGNHSDAEDRTIALIPEMQSTLGPSFLWLLAGKCVI
jgi:hypothetical protein